MSQINSPLVSRLRSNKKYKPSKENLIKKTGTTMQSINVNGFGILVDQLCSGQSMVTSNNDDENPDTND
ncbi:hypothetical protein BpHYR1_038533 [Brachionus plicatilis]|uniref:Uncharacterized protein n=1 Tax=Brachionus plicatilis TaxID=10195 RepID=A0A3M7QTD6_BRAPC|nr:hypothetical protein BpHYR1_038533 [Brachionus plicatilis]